MSKYCMYCGALHDEAARFCPKCGKSTSAQPAPAYQTDSHTNPAPPVAAQPKKQSEAPIQNNKNAKKNNTNQTKAYKKIIAVLLAVLIALSGCVGALVYFKNSPMSKKDDNLNIISGKFTDIAVTDEDSAIAAAKEAVAQMGLGNAADELTVKNVSTVGELSYYRLQQNYQGVPVYGKDIIIVADEVGNAWSVSSNMLDIPTELDTDAELTEDEIISKAAEFLDASASSLSILSSEKIIRVDEKAQLVYHTYLSSEATEYNLYIPVDGEAVSYGNLGLDPAEVCKNEADDKLEFNGTKITVEDVFENPMDAYVLFDCDEKFYCFDAQGKTTVDFVNQVYIKNSARAIKSSTKTFDSSSSTAFIAAENLKKIKNYYLEKYTDPGYGGLAIFINDDAGTVGGELELSRFDDFKYSDYKEEYIGVIHIGVSESDKAADVKTMAHEYTHTITRNIVNWSYKVGTAAEASCINEAYSDLFGMIIEAYINGTPEKLSWNYRTDIANLPKNKEYPKKVNAKKTYEQTSYVVGSTGETTFKAVYVKKYEIPFMYAYAATLNYAAYLMTTGGDASSNLTIAELADLWYHNLMTLHSDCSFSAFRYGMETTAKNLGFSEEKQERISDAFKKIGVKDPKNKDEAIKTPVTTEETTEKADTNFSEEEAIKAFERMLKYSGSVWGWNVTDEGYDNCQFSSMSNSEIVGLWIAYDGVPVGIYEVFSPDGTNGIKYTKEPSEDNAFSDPKGKFYASYMLDADLVDWILENVFGKKPDRSTDLDNMYYLDDVVYVSAEIGPGPEYIYKITDYQKLSDGKYDIYVEGTLDNGSMETIYLKFTATPKKDSEKGIYWQIHSYEKTTKGNSSAASKGNSTQNAKALFEQYLTDNVTICENFPYNGLNSVGGFSRIIKDLDNDGTEELVLFSITYDEAYDTFVLMELYEIVNNEVQLADSVEKIYAGISSGGAWEYDICATLDNNVIKMYKGFCTGGGNNVGTDYLAYKIENNKIVICQEFSSLEMGRYNSFVYEDELTGKRYSSPEEYDSALKAAGFDLDAHNHFGGNNPEFELSEWDYHLATCFGGDHIFTLANTLGPDKYYGFIFDNTGYKENVPGNRLT